MEVELQECYSTIKALKENKQNKDIKYTENIRLAEKEYKKKFKNEKSIFEQEKEKHVSCVEEMIKQK